MHMINLSRVDLNLLVLFAAVFNEGHVGRTAERLKARWHELDTGHYPMLSAPDDLTRLLLAS